MYLYSKNDVQHLLLLKMYLKERSMIVMRSPCFKRSDCCSASPLISVGFTELKLVKMS